MLHTRRTMRWLVMLAVLGVLLAKVTAAAASGFDDFLSRLAPPPSGEALDRIPDPGRRLLALRSYLRAGSGLAARWSWTNEEIKDFDGSPAQQALLAEIGSVSAHFAAANPGYEIYVHAQVRSLDTQIDHWNTNASVAAAADELVAAWTKAFGRDAITSPSIDPEKACAWLRGYAVASRPSIAAPGLTLHGRAQAIDFQVMKNGAIVAGADTAKIESVWRAQEWDRKLNASVEAAGPSFHGPLQSPDEPWHYDYAPAGPAAAGKSGR